MNNDINNNSDANNNNKNKNNDNKRKLDLIYPNLNNKKLTILLEKFILKLILNKFNKFNQTTLNLLLVCRKWTSYILIILKKSFKIYNYHHHNINNNIILLDNLINHLSNNNSYYQLDNINKLIIKDQSYQYIINLLPKFVNLSIIKLKINNLNIINCKLIEQLNNYLIQINNSNNSNNTLLLKVNYKFDYYYNSNNDNNSIKNYNILNNDSGLLNCLSILKKVKIKISGNFTGIENQQQFNSIFRDFNKLSLTKIEINFNQNYKYKHFSLLSILKNENIKNISISNGFFYLDELNELLSYKKDSLLYLDCHLNMMNFFPININNSKLFKYNNIENGSIVDNSIIDKCQIFKERNSIFQWIEFCNSLKSNTVLKKLNLSNCSENQEIDDWYFLNDQNYKFNLKNKIYEFFGKDYKNYINEFQKEEMEGKDNDEAYMVNQLNLINNKDELNNYLYRNYKRIEIKDDLPYKIYYDNEDIKMGKENQSQLNLFNLINKRNQLSLSNNLINNNNNNRSQNDQIKLNKYVLNNQLFFINNDTNNKIILESIYSNNDYNVQFNLLEYFKIRDKIRKEFASVWKENRSITQLEINNLQIISSEFFKELAYNNQTLTDLILDCKEFNFSSKSDKYYIDIINSFCEMIENNKTLRSLTITCGSFIFTNNKFKKSIEKNQFLNIKILKSHK